MSNIKMKSVILARVSSKEQDETGYSLPSQEKLLNEYGQSKNLLPAKLFSISESASGQKQRATFNEMVAYVKKHDIKNIICEKVDRLTRNFRDAVAINDWIGGDAERRVHFVKENVILNKESKSNEKFIWNIKVSVAQYYLDNLSEEVKKGQKEKIAQGWLPTRPLPGYKTVGEKGHKIHILDENMAPIARKMFDYFLSGEYSVDKLTKKMSNEGLRNIKGNKIVKSRIHKLLTDPFYIGKIRWNGVVTDGKQDPLITPEIFERTQQILSGRCTPKYSKHLYLYNKLIRCFECGGIITWETHKGITYGHCNHYRSCTQKTWSTEKEVDEQLEGALDRLQLHNQRIADWLRKALKESHQDEIIYHSSAINELYQRQTQLKQRLDRLYDDKLDGKITQDFYQSKFQQYSGELDKVSNSVKGHNTATTKYFEFGINIFELSQKAKDLFLKAKKLNLIDEQRRLLKLVFTEMKLNEGALTYKYTPTFTLLSEAVVMTNSSKIRKIEQKDYRNLEPIKKPDTMRKSGDFYPHQPIWLPR
ncbi:MAG: hypothetical protein A2905_00445 [Candidatus Levybacteria bacterium RIFCSPLOWO2_01_FULL_36_10]|nr:MAG: hypothetical protein A2905_00445 [Candidatus Levybacteria bacterium RIFCSPLOWO2_01_FULL_36_10]